MKKATLAALLLCAGSAAAEYNAAIKSDAERMEAAQYFARTLVQNALPNIPIAKLLIAANKDPGAVPYSCHIELGANPPVISARAAQTPERACYLAIERLRTLAGDGKP